MDRILITGGNGFIGKHVANNLRERGLTPVIFDHRNDWLNPDEIFVGDVKDWTDVLEAVKYSDGVIHLAGVLGTAETVEHPLPSVHTNILGSLNVFKACRKFNLKCTYISVGNYWMNNSYSITKDAAERFAWMFNKELNSRISVVRALNAYGPGQKSKPVRKIIPNFILPALKDEVITVYGDGSQVMDMIYVKDLADILVRSLIVDHNFYIHQPLRDAVTAPKFDAGTGRFTTVQMIAELVIDMVGSGRIEHAPMRRGEPEHSVVVGEPETLRPLYDGKVPDLVPLEEGLISTIRYYKQCLEL